MPTLETVLIFLAAALALNVTPGPSILYVMSRSVGQGTSAGLVSALGLGVGSLLHAAAAALGLSVVLAYSPAVYTGVKHLGAGYLVFLGVRMLLARAGQGSAAVRADVSLSRVFGQGVVTELLNPKIVLFFLSFLPQFVDPARGSIAGQTLLFGLLFHVTGVPVNIVVAVAGGSIARWGARRPVFERARNAMAGAVLIGLGVRLALSERR
jgi:threonine/homoserine/homoserine lactone efflux protein